MQTTDTTSIVAKFIKPAQTHLFIPDLSPCEYSEMALAEKPSLDLRESNAWHIGYIEQLTADSGRFVVGRTPSGVIPNPSRLQNGILRCVASVGFRVIQGKMQATAFLAQLCRTDDEFSHGR